MELQRQLIREGIDKLKHYGPVPMIALSRPVHAIKDPAGIAALLTEAVGLVDLHAKRQGKRRMGAREMGAGGVKYQSWICPNPGAGTHYPAVQSFLDRARLSLQPSAAVAV